LIDIQKRISELKESLQKAKQVNYKIRDQLVKNEKQIHGLSNRIDELKRLQGEIEGDE
jgi:predicted  nucleic acid-binding Zn-ribbon protein